MVSCSEKHQCTGCGVCEVVCPQKSISLKRDAEGFSYPEIDGNTCADCGKCDRLCHAQNVSREDTETPEVLIAYNKKKEERETSSSGGVFVEFAKRVISKDGSVYGAGFDKNFNVCHKKAASVEDLREIQGSKYVQSYVEPAIYTSVKEELEQGKQVLYSGTPCQIGALNTYLGKNYENLLTVSFICHGVPSPLVWDKYKSWQENRNASAISGVSFRNKDKGWTDYSMKITFENGKIYSRVNISDPYLQLFLKNTCLRPSCHRCLYKGKEALSDIDVILGDKWGNVSGSLPNMDDNRGISLVLLNSVKAKEMWNEISSEFYYDRTDFQQAIDLNVAYKHSAKPGNRKEVFENIDKLPIDVLHKKYAKTPFGTIFKSMVFKILYKPAKALGIVKFLKYIRTKL